MTTILVSFLAFCFGVVAGFYLGISTVKPALRKLCKNNIEMAERIIRMWDDAGERKQS